LSTATATAPQPAAASARAARYDIYAGIHRGLRLFMTDTLGRLGWLDCGDAAETAATLQQMDSLLAFCRKHLEHENSFLHPMLEACHAGSSQRVADEHVQHLQAIAALQAETATLRAAPSAPQALRLYRHLALFIAENLQHMQVEESLHNATLWAACSDAEIMALEQRLVAALGPAEQALVLRWMAPALPPAERAAWLGQAGTCAGAGAGAGPGGGLTQPRSACGASRSRGRRWRPGGARPRRLLGGMAPLVSGAASPATTRTAR
jgi:hypothetical protein